MHRQTEATDSAAHPLYQSPAEITSPAFFARLTGRAVATVQVTPLTAEFAHSGSQLSTVEVDFTDGGTPDRMQYILKRLNPEWDWLMQVTEDTHCRSVTLWSHGVFDHLPHQADTATIACAHDEEGYAILMRAVGDTLVTNRVFTEAQNAAFVDTLAAMHARFLDRTAPVHLADPALGLCRTQDVFQMFSPASATRFVYLDRGIHRRIHEGWAQVREVMPADVADIVLPLANDPGPLVTRLEQFPHTLVHGDYRHSNLGLEYGRTIMLDWQLATYGPPAIDLARYIGANSPFLPVPKEQILATYRERLEEHLTAERGEAAARAIDEWWEAQLYLSLLGGFIQDGWAIALKATTWDITENTREQWKADLPWWSAVIRRGAAFL
ncbi:MAG: phosphotransferase [Alkalispirochaeta sp.]